MRLGWIAGPDGPEPRPDGPGVPTLRLVANATTAVREIIEQQDASAFLAASGYDPS